MKPDRISLQPVHDLTSLSFYKQAFLDGLKAPLDGMWDIGLIPQAPHHELFVDGQSVGFIAINDEHVAVQCFIVPEAQHQAVEIVRTLRAKKVFDRAFAATLDPDFYRTCQDLGGSFEVHTLLYEQKGARQPCASTETVHTFRPVHPTEADQTFEFQRLALSLPDPALPWLRGYTTDLIQKQQLRVLLDAKGTWLGTGEFRISPTQLGVVDLGVIVSPEWRGKGYATDILNRLVQEAVEQNMTPICSTTMDNPSSQKAIERAGFSNTHHIDIVRFD